MRSPKQREKAASRLKRIHPPSPVFPYTKTPNSDGFFHLGGFSPSAEAKTLNSPKTSLDVHLTATGTVCLQEYCGFTGWAAKRIGIFLLAEWWLSTDKIIELVELLATMVPQQRGWACERLGM
jgi:hypothetical protein